MSILKTHPAALLHRRLNDSLRSTTADDEKEDDASRKEGLAQPAERIYRSSALRSRSFASHFSTNACLYASCFVRRGVPSPSNHDDDNERWSEGIRECALYGGYGCFRRRIWRSPSTKLSLNVDVSDERAGGGQEVLLVVPSGLLMLAELVYAEAREVQVVQEESCNNVLFCSPAIAAATKPSLLANIIKYITIITHLTITTTFDPIGYDKTQTQKTPIQTHLTTPSIEILQRSSTRTPERGLWLFRLSVLRAVR